MNTAKLVRQGRTRALRELRTELLAVEAAGNAHSFMAGLIAQQIATELLRRGVPTSRHTV